MGAGEETEFILGLVVVFVGGRVGVGVGVGLWNVLRWCGAQSPATQHISFVE